MNEEKRTKVIVIDSMSAAVAGPQAEVFVPSGDVDKMVEEVKSMLSSMKSRSSGVVIVDTETRPHALSRLLELSRRDPGTIFLGHLKGFPEEEPAKLSLPLVLDDALKSQLVAQRAQEATKSLSSYWKEKIAPISVSRRSKSKRRRRRHGSH